MSYRKVDQRLHTSATIRSLSENARWLYFYLLTSPHNNALCCYRLPDGYGAEDMGWDIPRYRTALNELVTTTRPDGTPLVIHDPQASLVMVWGQLQKEGFVNPNAVRAAMRCLQELPTRSTIYQHVYEACLSLDEIQATKDKAKDIVKPLLSQLAQLLQQQLPEQLGDPHAGDQEQDTGAGSPPKKPPAQSPHLFDEQPGARPEGSPPKGQKPNLDTVLKDTGHAFHGLGVWFQSKVWTPYPSREGRKTGRVEAWEWICRKRPGPDMRALIEAKLADDLASSDWQKGFGIKDCVRWLRAGEKNGWRLDNAGREASAGAPERDPFAGMREG